MAARATAGFQALSTSGSCAAGENSTRLTYSYETYLKPGSTRPPPHRVRDGSHQADERGTCRAACCWICARRVPLHAPHVGVRVPRAPPDVGSSRGEAARRHLPSSTFWTAPAVAVRPQLMA